MITALYASISAALMIWLSIQVIKQRRSAQGNAMDYIPITLFLMAMVEFNGASPWMIHLAGIVFVIGRLMHAKAVLAEKLKGRITGMKLTFLVMAVLIVLNLVYLPFGKLW
ncbi:MAPEG family protein [Vibrio coralliilyticus]|uniref:MAPEG family protein n=1 Tax=Vibrio coralliilyticus TaxID=190893 RepID=UPI0015616CB3|nr:MAPEG family protein [Vibrio coralliilyticus]NRF23893.1 MAPEG family protein [Vibrio coralliilyticus]NRF78309.1 MAPEG family protein [Vibrio coralliilyticus]